MTIFSIGHSTHPEADFAHLAEGLDVIIDVRSHPTSKWPQWRLENMHEWLPPAGFRVAWLPSLGGWTKKHWEQPDLRERMAVEGVDLKEYASGRFPKHRIGRPTRGQGNLTAKPVWTNQGLFDYAWYTTTEDFKNGLRMLVEDYGGKDQPKAAIMCCEAVWWKCHRSMIADVLWAAHRIDVLHFKDSRPKRPSTPRWTYHSQTLCDRLQRYPAPVLDSWFS